MRLLRRHSDGRSAFRPNLAACLMEYLPPAPQAQPAHSRGDDHIRPPGAGPEYAYGSRSS
jgi:hypothetical protein